MAFTQRERDALADLLGDTDGADGNAVLRNLLEKMDRALAVTPGPGLAVQLFEGICRHHLRGLLALPAKPSPSWYSRIARTLRDVGATEEDARLAAQHAATFLRNPVGLEYMSQRVIQFAAAARQSAAGGGDAAQAGCAPEFKP